jgi:hypothetical protein
MKLKFPTFCADCPLGQTIMSHLHHIDGFANTAAQYQAYLERMRAAHLAENEGRTRRKSKPAAFRVTLEPQEDEGQTDDQTQSDEGQEKPEQDTDSNRGFGNHYA